MCLFLVLQVRAEKQITIEEAPNVLTIHLKRFQFGGMGSKITKPVDYDKEMNLQPFMSRPECGPQVSSRCMDLPPRPACIFTLSNEWVHDAILNGISVGFHDF